MQTKCSCLVADTCYNDCIPITSDLVVSMMDCQLRG